MSGGLVKLVITSYRLGEMFRGFGETGFLKYPSLSLPPSLILLTWNTTCWPCGFADGKNVYFYLHVCVQSACQSQKPRRHRCAWFYEWKPAPRKRKLNWRTCGDLLPDGQSRDEGDAQMSRVSHTVREHFRPKHCWKFTITTELEICLKYGQH